MLTVSPPTSAVTSLLGQYTITDIFAGRNGIAQVASQLRSFIANSIGNSLKYLEMCFVEELQWTRLYATRTISTCPSIAEGKSIDAYVSSMRLRSATALSRLALNMP
jgi:hypothetical protein